MAIIGLSLATERSYESRFDAAKGTPEATKFLIGSLDSRIYGRLKDQATTMNVDPSRPNDEIKTSINNNDVSFEVVAYGLRGWEGLKDANNNDIAFLTEVRRHGGQTYKVVSGDVLKLIPQAIIMELAGQIMKANEVSDLEVKN